MPLSRSHGHRRTAARVLLAALPAGGCATGALPQPATADARERGDAPAATAATAAPGATPAAPAAKRPAPEGDVATRCTKDPAREAPVARGRLGSGSRFVEIVNDGSFELQARLLDGDEKVVVPGTLRVPAGENARFEVEPGTFRLRYRNQESCVVFLGTPFEIGAEHAGVAIHIKPVEGVGRPPPRAVDDEL